MANYTIKYKNNSLIGMVCYIEAISTVVDETDAIEAAKTFASNLVTGGVTNVAADSEATILADIAGVSGITIDAVLDEINTMQLRDGANEVLILEAAQ